MFRTTNPKTLRPPYFFHERYVATPLLFHENYILKSSACRLHAHISDINYHDTYKNVFIRWQINRSYRFSDFLRKIIKSIFSKFWKREFQFFSDFQNFFGFLMFREKYSFWYTFQISRRYGKCEICTNLKISKQYFYKFCFVLLEYVRRIYHFSM